MIDLSAQLESGCIVVSGEACAGSSILAIDVARRLGYEYFSVGDYVRRTFAAKEDVTLAKAYSPQGTLSDTETQRRIDQVQIERAEARKIVIDSKLGLHVLQGMYRCGVWLVANRQTRARRLSERAAISHRAALLALRKREREEARVWASLYGLDIAQLSQRASISVDTSAMEVQQVSDLVMEKISNLQKER